MRLIIISCLLFFAANACFGQSMFMQRFKMANNDSSTINVSEVRICYELANGNAQLMYSYPYQPLDTKTDFDAAVSNSCGNLVAVNAKINGQTKRVAINPQWINKIYRTLQGKIALVMRESGTVIEVIGTYESVSAFFDDCMGGPGALTGVTHDGTLTGNGTVGSPLKVDTSVIATQHDLSLIHTIYDDSDTINADDRWVRLKKNLEFLSDNDAGHYHVDMGSGVAGTLYRQTTDTIQMKYYDLGGTNNVVVDQSGVKVDIGSSDRLQINLGSDALGDIYYRNVLGNFVRIPIGAQNKVLQVRSSVPTWMYTDTSFTNEIQTIDTLSSSGTTISASLSQDGVPAKTLNLGPMLYLYGADSTWQNINGTYAGKTKNTSVYRGGNTGIGTTDTIGRFNIAVDTFIKPAIYAKVVTSQSGMFAKFAPVGYSGLTRGSFNIVGGIYRGVNAPISVVPNYVYDIGFNCKVGGIPEVSGQPTLDFGFETFYANAALHATDGFMEAHWRTFDTFNIEHRHISFVAPWNGGRNRDVMSIASDQFNLLDFGNSQVWAVRPLTNTWSISDTTGMEFTEARGFALRVYNGAGSAAMSLLDFNNTDTLEIGRQNSPATRINNMPVFHGSKIYPNWLANELQIGSSSGPARGSDLWINQKTSIPLRFIGSTRTWGFENSGNLAISDITGGTTPLYMYTGNSDGAFIFRSNNFGVNVSGAFPEAVIHGRSTSGATAKLFRFENSTGYNDLFRSTATPESAITSDPGSIATTNISGVGGLYVKLSGTATATGWDKVLTSTTGQAAQTITRALPTTVGNTINIGFITKTGGGGYYFELVAEVSASGTANAKKYRVPSTYDATFGVWQVLLPEASTGSYASEDFEVEIKGTGYIDSLRLRRTAGTTATTVYVGLILTSSASFVSFTENSATGSPASVSTTYSYNAIAQIANKVGLNVNAPARTFDNAGETRLRDLITDNPIYLVGADGDGDLSRAVLGSGLSFSNDTLSSTGGAADGNGIYGDGTSGSGDDNLPTGGTDVGMNALGKTIRWISDIGANTTREMMRFHVNNDAFTRFMVFKTLEDSCRFFHDPTGSGRQFTLQAYGGAALSLATDSTLVYTADSIKTNEGAIETKTKVAFFQGLTSAGIHKRFEGSATGQIPSWNEPGGYWELAGPPALAPTTLRPSTLAATTDDWNPTGYSTTRDQIILLSGDGSFRCITGLTAATRDGVQKTFSNIGTNCLIMAKLHTGSSSANRFSFSRDLILYPNMSATVAYDSVNAVWLLRSTTKGNVTFGNMIEYEIASNTGTTSNDPALSLLGAGGSVSVTGASGTGQPIRNLSFSTSTVLNAWVGFQSRTAPIYLAANTSYIRLYAKIKTGSNLSTAAEDYDIRMGLKGSVDTSITEGAYISYQYEENSGGWTIKTNDGSTTTNVNAGGALTTSTNYTLELIYYPYGEVTAFINGTRYTKTSNLPTLLGVFSVIMIDKDNGSSARSFDLRNFEVTAVNVAE